MRDRLVRHEAVLAALIALEWGTFAVTGARFGTLENIFDIIRHSAEVALIATAMTGVILTGGIDLSVGSLLGVCAVVLGKLWRDAGWPWPCAALAAVLVGAVGGAVNGSLIDRLRLPPLIVTLGTYSLFRGLAEVMTRGADTFTGFPGSFLALGQERWLGMPAQLPIVAVVIVGYGLALQRTMFGRTLRAMGQSFEGARFAGLPVARDRGWVYILSGSVSGLAAAIYTARLGQAKADAGTGFELTAITAVVLGGTSIFGGRGSLLGTLLGVAALAILENGLVHARWPREAGGVLTGGLLVLALIAGTLPKIWLERRRRRATLSQPQIQIP